MLQRRLRAQQLLAESSKVLCEAVNLGLQHHVSSSVLAESALNLLECHGQHDPAAAGQYLALFQVQHQVTFTSSLLQNLWTCSEIILSVPWTRTCWASSSYHLGFCCQSCCTAVMAEEVLSSACADTSESQLSALLSVRSNILLSQEERPRCRLKEVQDSLNSLSKVPGHKEATHDYDCSKSTSWANFKIFILF